MDHDYITGQDVVGRYMSGTLSLDDRSRFEEHFIDCPQCLDALEHLDQFRRALRSVAADEAAARHTALETARPRLWWTHTIARLAGAAAVVVIGVTSLDLIRTRRELARVAALSEGRGRQSLGSESRLRELSNQIQNLQRAERAAGRQSSAPVFALTRVRSVGGAPANRVIVSGQHEWVVLLLELDAANPAIQYRVTLRAQGGRQVWADDQLRASTTDALGISVRSTLLSSGDYVLTVEQRAPQATSWTPAGRYDLRVASTP